MKPNRVHEWLHMVGRVNCQDNSFCIAKALLYEQRRSFVPVSRFFEDASLALQANVFHGLLRELFIAVSCF